MSKRIDFFRNNVEGRHGNDAEGEPCDLLMETEYSGPGARGCNIDWIRGVVQQCQSAGVPVFVKQLGAHPYSYPAPGDKEPRLLNLRDRTGGNPGEWPDDLRVREWPHE